LIRLDTNQIYEYSKFADSMVALILGPALELIEKRLKLLERKRMEDRFL
jgi:hypothetical protein